MKQHCIDKKTGISYTSQGDYYLPDLILPAEKENRPVGVWGQRHLRYLKQHRRIPCTNLITNGKLNSYLADIDEQSENMFFRLVEQMAERESITEQLKADNQTEWIARMNNIRSRAAEIVNAGLIYN
ncbi:TnpV protein [Blautia hydrogenotrophica]|uniref:TnpV protein n=1 Tax=Blautia hydrogenotrophica TaxID=53443 RepID=UPI002E77D2F5|nr:TnpV protein [Blautia hydrogenotrophica]MEE0464094.1 TnpV protein [Blautia hydrogenotrophica]